MTFWIVTTHSLIWQLFLNFFMLHVYLVLSMPEDKAEHQQNSNLRILTNNGGLQPKNVKERRQISRSGKIFEDYEECLLRCERLLTRSLARIGYTPKIINNIYRNAGIQQEEKDNSLEALKTNNTYFNDICWKYFDHSDCTKQCEHSKINNKNIARRFRKKRRQNSSRRLQIATKLLLKDCKVAAPKKLLDQFRCVHKYRTFLDVKCSSYAKEALRLRLKHLEIESQERSFHEKTKENNQNETNEEVCRFIHYHSMCLSNSIYHYCPTTIHNDTKEDTVSIFNRFTLRDYFLSYILPLPRQEQLFSDVLLDECQLYDFQKMAKDIYASTRIYSIPFEMNAKDKIFGDRIPPQNTIPSNQISSGNTFTLTSTTPKRRTTRNWIFSSTNVANDEHTATTLHHRLFSSEEDLADTPPNFHYSSAKYQNSPYYNYNYYSTTSRSPFKDLTESSIIENNDFSTEKTTLTSRVGYKNIVRLDPTKISITFPDKYPSNLELTTVTMNEEIKIENGNEKNNEPIISKIHTSKLEASNEIITTNSEPSTSTDSIDILNKNSYKSNSREESTTLQTFTRLPIDEDGSIQHNTAKTKWQTLMATSADKHLPHSIRANSLSPHSNKLPVEDSEYHFISQQKQQSDPPLSVISSRTGTVYRDSTGGFISHHIQTSSSETSTKYAIFHSDENNPVSTDRFDERNIKLVIPTPMLDGSHVHVKKIVPYDELEYSDELSENNSEDGYNDENLSTITSKEYDNLNDRFNYADNTNNNYDYNVEYSSSTEYGVKSSSDYNSINDPYTIVSIKPLEQLENNKREHIPLEIEGKSQIPKSNSGVPSHVESVPEQQLDTWLVLLGIYSAFFAISLCSLSCILCVCAVRKYRYYANNSMLKWSWISSDMQEHI